MLVIKLKRSILIMSDDHTSRNMCTLKKLESRKENIWQAEETSGSKNEVSK